MGDAGVHSHLTLKNSADCSFHWRLGLQPSNFGQEIGILMNRIPDNILHHFFKSQDTG